MEPPGFFVDFKKKILDLRIAKRLTPELRRIIRLMPELLKLYLPELIPGSDLEYRLGRSI